MTNKDLAAIARINITEAKRNISKFTERELGTKLVIDITASQQVSLLVLLTVNDDLTANCLSLHTNHDCAGIPFDVVVTQVKRDLAILQPLTDYVGNGEGGLNGAIKYGYL